MLGLFKRRERKSKTGEKDDLTDFLNPEKLSQTSTREDDDSLRDGMASPPPSPKVVGPTSILTNSDRRPSKLQKKSPVSTVAAAAAVAQRDSASPRSASVASSQVDVSNPPLKSAMSALSQDHRLDSSPLMQGRLTAQNDLQPGSQPRPLTTREAMAAEARAANQKQNQARPLQQEPHPLQESLGRNSPLDEIVNLGQSPHLNGGLHGWGASAANGRPSEDRIESSPEPELVTAPQSRDQDRPNLTQGYQSGESSLIVAKPTSPAPTHPPPPAPTREVTAPNSHQDSFSPTQDLAQYREHSRQRSRDIDSVSLSSTEQPLSKDPKRMATPPSPVSPPSSESSKDDEQSVEIRETYDPDDASERQTRPYQQGSGHKHQQYDREVVSLPSTESSSLMEQNGKEIQTPSTVNTSATWSDAGLREWFDGDRGMQEVRDLLVIIGDVNGVEPVDDDHPGVRGMFDEESKALENMNKVRKASSAGMCVC